MIIAVDYDETLNIGGTPNVPLIRRLQMSQRNGDIVILWTCREGKSLFEALDFLMANGFRPNFVNQNTPEMIRKFGNDCRKIFADIYIDDKAVRP